MISEKTLLIVSIIAGIVGVILLYFFSGFQENNNTTLITGKVIDVIEKEKVSFITLETPLKLVSFKKTNARLGEKKTFKGKLQNYNGEVEFVIS